MLTRTDDGVGVLAPTVIEGAMNETDVAVRKVGARRRQLANVLRVEWLGQTAASVCWIASVFAYGVSSPGDWLQLGAASAWLIANLAAASTDGAD